MGVLTEEIKVATVVRQLTDNSHKVAKLASTVAESFISFVSVAANYQLGQLLSCELA